MWSLVILTMCAIFFFSHQSGEVSSQLSDNVINIVEDTQTLKEEPNQYIKVTRFVRKSAHILIYTALGFFLMGALSLYKGKWYVHSLLAVIIGTLYAASDEWHQTFIPNRLGSLYDVKIDFFGVVAGVLIMLLIVTVINKIKNHKASA